MFLDIKNVWTMVYLDKIQFDCTFEQLSQKSIKIFRYFMNNNIHSLNKTIKKLSQFSSNTLYTSKYIF